MPFWKRETWRTDDSAADVNHQERCVDYALMEGLKAAAYSLAVSSVVILGACKVFPRFNRTLSVSSRTALIVSPPFGAFALLTELSMSECAQRRKDMQYAARKASDDAKAAAAAAAAAAQKAPAS